MNEPLGASVNVGDIWNAILMSIRRQFSNPFLLQLVKSQPFFKYLPPEKGTPPLIVHYRVYPPPPLPLRRQPQAFFQRPASRIVDGNREL